MSLLSQQLMLSYDREEVSHLGKVLGHRQAKGLEDAGVKQRAKLPKAVQRKHQRGRNDSAKELRKHIYKGCVPVAACQHKKKGLLQSS